MCGVLALAVSLGGCEGSGSVSVARTAPRARLIVPQRSIDRLALGMTPARVRELYGEPDRVEDFSESESGSPILAWRYHKRGITAEFRDVKGTDSTLAGIFTTSAHQRTASEVGVGSTEAELSHNLDGLDCGPADPGQRWCRSLTSTPTTSSVAIESSRAGYCWCRVAGLRTP